jgi:hypothetical protein
MHAPRPRQAKRALRELPREVLEQVAGGKYIGETEKHLAVPAAS